jgi:hypothetical protein
LVGYESGDPWALADVALATDCIMTLLAERTERPLFAVESLLNRDQLVAIGARQMPKKLERSRKSGGRDRIEPVTPTMEASFETGHRPSQERGGYRESAHQGSVCRAG